jgi:GTP1/Obg family GTP-binding protein
MGDGKRNDGSNRQEQKEKWENSNRQEQRDRFENETSVVKEFRFSVSLAPWYDELVDAMSDLVNRCMDRGMPAQLAYQIATEMLEQALTAAAQIGTSRNA